jgi:hypothetical protein
LCSWALAGIPVNRRIVKAVIAVWICFMVIDFFKVISLRA